MRYNASFWFVCNFLAIILLELLFPLDITFSWALPFGVLLLLIAIGVARRSKYLYSHHNTSYDPNKKALFLITEDIYTLSRNPIYIALLFAFVGISLVLSLNYLPLGALSLFLTLSKIVIPHEEIELHDIFGNWYLQYRLHTPKWL
jgi:protein-S-isoprenylcysteine O-methyltransferase Ste14